jgi:ABC-type transporter Mla subunit MlaD
MPHHPARNRVIAGGFFVAAMAAVVVVLILVGKWDVFTKETQGLHIRFRSAPNIRVGGPVLLAGHLIGQIEAISLVKTPCPPGDKRGDCYMVDVLARIPAEYGIRKDARIFISQALVGQSASLNIEDVGMGPPVTDFIEGRETSAFAGAGDELAGAVGIGPEQRKAIQEFIEHMRDVSLMIKTDGKEFLEQLKTVGPAIKKISDILDENRDNVKSAIANVKSASENVKSASEKIDKGAGEVVDEVKTTVRSARTIVEENRDDIRKAVANVRGVTESAKKDIDEIVANVRTGSEGLKKAVADFEVVASRAKALIVTNGANLSGTLQNFHETSEHLKALAKEVRRAPWRMFSTPDKKEVESLNLYDAARAFASAATDLDATADTLEVMIEAKKQGIDVDPEMLKGMLDRLKETFKNYQQAENGLLQEFMRIQK